MVILKVNAADSAEREIAIVSESGLWKNGIYLIFDGNSLSADVRHSDDAIEKSDPGFLGEFNINKEKANWEYRGKSLSDPEQKEVANFIIDYQAPDAVY